MNATLRQSKLAMFGEPTNLPAWIGAALGLLTTTISGTLLYLKKRNDNDSKDRSERRQVLAQTRQQQAIRIEKLETLLDAERTKRDQEKSELSDRLTSMLVEISELRIEVERLRSIETKFEEVSQHNVTLVQENSSLKTEVTTLRVANATLSDQVRALGAEPHYPLGKPDMDAKK